MGAREMCYSQRMPSAKGKIARTLDPVDLAAERRTKAAYPWRFQPGESGNPGGLSKFYWETRRLARDAAPASETLTGGGHPRRPHGAATPDPKRGVSAAVILTQVAD